MKISSIELAQQVVLACKAKNIKHIIISPGSRNAPLTISFTNDSFFECYSIVDERCSAFTALGMAQQLQYPVAVVCTSGSALLNYYPAVSEAFYSDIPLVVISADRPSNKIDIGDGQTIRQKNVFANHSRYNANLSEDENQKSANNYELNQALNTAIVEKAPVHINVPFEEPLYQTIDANPTFQNLDFEPITQYLLEEDLNDFIQNWEKSTQKMVLVGVLNPNSLEQKYIDFLVQDPNVLVLTETTSNLHHSDFIPSIDKLLTAIEKNPDLVEKLRPEVLLTFGGMVVSKKIKQFLRKNQPAKHYHVDLHKGYDSYFCLTKYFKADINYFMDKITPKINVKSLPKGNYKEFWTNIFTEIRKSHSEYLKDVPYSDMWVYEQIFDNLPNDIQLQMSNSSTIRYAQLFDLNPTWEQFCNRGTSGIDGSVSTAIGASLVSDKQTVLVTGDLSFFYNSNALWNAYTPKNFRIILINNDGGGIFRILPGDKSDKNFEYYFETPHGLSAEYFCKAYGWEYSRATDECSVGEELNGFFEDNSQAPRLLEIVTPRKLNDKILMNYFRFFKK